MAIGAMGMRPGDFARLRPEEFEAAYKVWADREEMEYRNAWERARVVATICVSPHVKGRTNAKKILPLPWDHAARESPQKSKIFGDPEGGNMGKSRGEAGRLSNGGKAKMETREEGHRNLEAMIKAVGGKRG